MKSKERARKNKNIVLHHLARVGLEPIALSLKKDASTISRMKEKAIPEFTEFLAVLDLKIVPIHYRCVRPHVIEAYVTLIKEAMNQSLALHWDDEPAMY